MLETVLLYTSGKCLWVIKITSQVLPPNMQNCNVRWGNHASPNFASRKLWNATYWLRLCSRFLSWWGGIPYPTELPHVLWSPAMPSWLQCRHGCKQHWHQPAVVTVSLIWRTWGRESFHTSSREPRIKILGPGRWELCGKCPKVEQQVNTRVRN